VNRPALLLHSPIVVALGIAMSMVGGKLILAQLPGVCTLPDGSSWSGPDEFERDASRPSEIAARLSSTDGRNTQFSEIATDPQLVRRWLRGEVVSNSLPSQHVASNPQAAVINRYAPHSIPMTKDGSKSAIPIHNLSLRRLPQDDLLAPTGNNDATNLLEASPPSFAEGDVLSQMGPDAQREKERAATKTGDAGKQAAVDPHWEVYANDKYPSAIKCSKCHQKIYDEWRVSSHAYAAVSPMFHRFEQKVAELTRGTSGTFCLRCHAPVATQADFPRNASIFNGPIVFREGITCIACHRVIERYGRVNGERRIELGNEYDPVVGNIGGEGVQAVIADRDNFKVKIDPNDTRPLQPIHQGAIQFEQLSDSSFCAGCHQVVVQPGIALEIVYQQYRQGPACKKGVSCQDCHMGAVPGKPLGYTFGAAAEVSGKTINTQRKHSNHMFYGPAYPIAHPGIFPHNEKSLRWTADQWLQFDHRQGWGTERFEALLARGQITATFPPGWQIAQERRDARKVIDENEKLLAYKRQTAHEVLENGSRIDGPFFASPPRTGEDLKFSYVVSNSSEGHNMPSGSLGAQPQLWLNVVLIGPNGNHLWESGHLDSNGDMCDIHSLDVRAGKTRRDAQLANFQTKFLITNVKGTEREMYLPVNVDIDPLPFFRPGTVPYTVLNHPPFIRMEAHSIGPLDSRTPRYSIPSELIRMPGIYRLSVRLRSRVEPPYFLLFCDGTPEMLTSLNEGIIDVHPYSTEFVVR
jgi:nitrate/TMAO reductase-like tetraheme cytochrome c subunit